jgi:glucose-6-phosphate 1-dehydrogenase
VFITKMVGDINFRIDLAAEQMLIAEKENERIAVEIKSFIQQSPLHAFHEAMGQYDNYIYALEDYDPTRILYLAVPFDVYGDFFQKPFIQKVLHRKKVKLIIYEPISENITTWIK